MITQLKKGNRMAFKVIYDQYWDDLFQAAYNVLKDENIAKDVIQEVFTDFWNRIHHIEISNLSGYLYKAVRFQSLKQLRRAGLQDIHDLKFQEVLAVNNTQEQLDFNQLEESIEKSLGELPEKYKEVFEMSRYYNMSNKQIAEKLNLSTRTVEWYIHTVLKHLRTSLTILVLVVPHAIRFL